MQRQCWGRGGSVITPLELLLVILSTAVGAVIIINVVGWLIEALPARWLPGFIIGLVAVSLVLFGAAAAARVGALP